MYQAYHRPEMQEKLIELIKNSTGSTSSPAKSSKATNNKDQNLSEIQWNFGINGIINTLPTEGLCLTFPMYK